MNNKICLTMLLSLWAGSLNAQELVVYDDIAFVKNSLEFSFDKGLNKIQFEGIPSRIKQGSMLISGKNFSVLEQNYNYDLLNYTNLLEQQVGKEVKTVVQDPATGKSIFNKAILTSANNSNPILKFDYGYDAKFPGRVVFDTVPGDLSIKPVFEAKLKVAKKGNQNVNYSYLTSGLTWGGEYVLDVLDDNRLNVNAWININNESGTDFSGYKVRVVSGDVNVISTPNDRMPSYAMVRGVQDSHYSAKNSNTKNGDYYVYDVSKNTDILNRQSKQIKLFAAEKVKYNINYNIESPLYISQNNYSASFEKLNPVIEYVIENTKDNNLGLSFPKGNIRIYDEDAFLGENVVEGLVKKEPLKIEAGKSFDLYSSGKVVDVKKIADDIFEAEVKISFFNAKSIKNEVSFEQTFNGQWTVLSESISSVKTDAQTAKWNVKLKPNSSADLVFKVRISK